MTAQDPPTLRLADIARLLNVTTERARQLADREQYSFPAPVAKDKRSRYWDRDYVERWMDDVNWWGRYRWRKPAADV